VLSGCRLMNKSVKWQAGFTRTAKKGQLFYICQTRSVFVVCVNQGSMLWAQFSAIFDNFGRKNCFFLKKQCYDQIFVKNNSRLSKKPPIFCPQKWWNYLKNRNIGPWLKECQKLLGLLSTKGRQCTACHATSSAGSPPGPGRRPRRRWGRRRWCRCAGSCRCGQTAAWGQCYNNYFLTSVKKLAILMEVWFIYTFFIKLAPLWVKKRQNFWRKYF
jgi:hypothetical protein